MDRFDEIYHKLMEAMTAGGAGSVLNPNENKGFANGDERYVTGKPFIIGRNKKPQKRKLKNTL